MNNISLVQDINEVEIILEQFFRQGTHTNNYILAREYENVINERLLYKFISQDNAFLLLNKGNCYRVYYFINDTACYEIPDTDKVMVLEILYRGKSGFPDEMVKFWVNNNFKEHLLRDCYFLKPDQIIKEKTIMDPQVKIKLADTVEESEFARHLINKYLDPYTGDPLSLETLEEYRKSGYLFCAYFGDKMSGILQGEFKNNVWWLGHLVVDENFRGYKIGNVLTEAYIQKGLEMSCNLLQLWVIHNNEPAVNLYKKFGFSYFNRSTISLIQKT
ncbi:MAG: GNAT family N-acetyltransferase [Saprospiraceae bacterium]|nr:GNAT family N-acetyltransferase [Saprospiraceae bacterium]